MFLAGELHYLKYELLPYYKEEVKKGNVESSVLDDIKKDIEEVYKKLKKRGES